MAGFARGRRRRTVGVDIGSGFIKAAVIEHGAGTPRLVEFATERNEGGVASALAAMFERERIEPRSVAIGVGGRDVVSKVLEIERMDEEETRAVIPWEAEQHVPFDMDNVEIDFTIIDPNGDGPRMTVLLAAAKRSLIEERVSLLRRAALIPALVDVEALALLNAIAINHPEAMSDVCALVDIGNGAATVHLLREGLPVLTRELAVYTPTPDDLEECVHRVARGVRRAGAFAGSAAGVGIARIYLCGGGAATPGFAERLAEALGAETRLASACERLEVASAAADRPELEAMGPALLLSVGLALRQPAMES